VLFHATTERVTVTDAAGTQAELELVRRAQAGDADAFGALVERNRRAVFRMALAALGSPADADDVAQEALVTAFQKLGGFRGESSFRTWVLAITWRKALDRRKSVMRWMRRVAAPAAPDAQEFDQMDNLPGAAASQEEQTVTTDLHKKLRSLIASLPSKLRDPLLLAGSGDYSYDEIGRALGIPVGTVKWRVSEARRMLRQKMAALGYDNV
jgi:RNA polymerase sigma-70 factor, ECF subfamily